MDLHIDEINALLNAVTALVVAATALWIKVTATRAGRAEDEAKRTREEVHDLANGTLKDRVKKAMDERDQENGGGWPGPVNTR